MPTKDEKYHIVPYQNGFRVMADNGTYYSNKPLTKKRARQQQKALYAKQAQGQLFHGKGYSVLTHGGSSHIILEGEGFFGDILAKVKQTYNKVSTAFNKAVERVGLVSKGLRDAYPPKARETIAKYGDGTITALTIRREPIQKLLNLALDYITEGKWSQAKKELNYDRLFHLSLIASVELPNGTEHRVLLEKNEVINITDQFSSNRRTEYLRVPMVRPIPFTEFLQKAEEVGGSDYFRYDAFTNNCQMFIDLLLRANGLTDETTNNFIMQDVGTLIKKLPAYTAPLARAATNIAGLANVAFFGEGKQKEMPKQEITMKPKDFFAEHRKLVGLLDNISDKLKSEAKEQSSEAAGWKRKLEGKSNGVMKGGRMSHAEAANIMRELSMVASWEDIQNIYNMLKSYYINDDYFSDLINQYEDEYHAMVANPMNLGMPEFEAFNMRQWIRELPTNPDDPINVAPASAAASPMMEDPAEGEGKKGKGMSEAAKKHRAKLAAFARLSPEEQAKKRAEGEAGRQRIIGEIEDKQRKVDEWNAEMRRRRDSPFAPIVSGLTKLGDIAADMGSAVGMPSIVSDVYKTFAPPGSKYYDGQGRPVKWIQQVVKDMKKGAFTKQALRHKMTPQEFAKEVLANPKKYTLTTRRRAMFVKNVSMKGRGMCGGAISKDEAKVLMDKLEMIEDEDMSDDERWDIVNEVLEKLIKELPDNQDLMAAAETIRKRKRNVFPPKNVLMKVLEGVYGKIYGSGDEGEDDELARIFADSMSLGAPKEMAGRESRMEKPVAKPAPKKPVAKPVASKELPKPKKGVKRGRLSPIAEEGEAEGKGKQGKDVSPLAKYTTAKRTLKDKKASLNESLDDIVSSLNTTRNPAMIESFVDWYAEDEKNLEKVEKDLEKKQSSAAKAFYSGRTPSESGPKYKHASSVPSKPSKLRKGGIAPLLIGLAPTLLSSLFGLGKKKKFRGGLTPAQIVNTYNALMNRYDDIENLTHDELIELVNDFELLLPDIILLPNTTQEVVEQINNIIAELDLMILAGMEAEGAEEEWFNEHPPAEEEDSEATIESEAEDIERPHKRARGGRVKSQKVAKKLLAQRASSSQRLDLQKEASEPSTSFEKQLLEVGLTPDEYLSKARARAKQAGYDPTQLFFSDNPKKKLMIFDEKGRKTHFGAVGYGDYIIWLNRDRSMAEKKRDAFQASHSKIKGNWASNRYSPNNLALRILW